jgi:hypothetical protein
MRKGAVPLALASMCAPICVKGSMTRRMGRRISDASPTSTLSKGCALSRPASRRMDVPELPTPDVLVAALDRLGDGWAARVLALAAPDHIEVYLAGCDKRRADAIRQELMALPKTLPSGLAAAMTRFLRQGMPAVPAGDGAP